MPEMILLRMKEPGPLAISRCYIGEVVEMDGVIFKLTNVCALFEQLQQKTEKVSGQIVQEIGNSYQTSSIFSNGIVTFKNEDVEFHRAIGSNDEVLDGYHSSFKEFNKVKTKLIEIPSFAPKGN